MTYYVSHHPGIPTEVNGGNHTRQFATAARGTEAHYACLNVSKALAAVGVRVLTDDEYFAHVSRSFVSSYAVISLIAVTLRDAGQENV